MVRIYEMKQKEVVNVIDGTRLGYICDIVLDLETGNIIKIIVPGPGKVLGLFGKEMEYQIPWDSIKKIGEDIILVEINLEAVCKEADY